MNDRKVRIVPSLKEKEGAMAEFCCIKCNKIKNVLFQNFLEGDRLRGVVFCACGGQTVFETIEQTLSFISSREYPFSSPNPNVPQDARQKFTEAELCYFAPALRAAAIMLRASLESALTEKGIVKGTLDERIERALSDGVISKREYTLAHGTRLVGNDSVHQSSDIKTVEVQGLFGAVTQILDKLFP